MINVTSHDIQLAKQQKQRRYFKVQILNREWRGVNTVIGSVISGSINIQSEGNIKRTANLTMRVAKADADLYSHLSASYYVRLSCGIEDNNTSETTWYEQGVYIITNGGFNYDTTTRQLSLTLADLMTDLNGDRGGTFHAYTSIVKYEQKIVDVVKSVLELAGVKTYDLCPIGVLRETTSFFDENASETDELVPYDLKFSAGVTAYEILDKLVNLYPYYDMGFDVDGNFFVRRKTYEEDNSYVIVSAQQLESLVISEDTTIDWLGVKNIVEVWGKDGLYYGEAQDDNPNSPFNVSATRPMRLVVTSNTEGVDTNAISDRYIDTEKAAELLKQQAEYQAIIANLEALETLTPEEQAQLQQAKQDLTANKSEQESNLSIKGDELAEQWAKRLLYQKSRLYDNISLSLVGLPFLNDTDFKISYRSKIDDEVKVYVVKSISHDLKANTTSLTAIRFYNEQITAYQSQLAAPVITAHSVDGMTVTVTVNAVPFAEKYGLLIDYKQVAVFTGTTLSYTLPDEYEGSHLVAVRAYADGFQPNGEQNYITVTFTSYDVLATDGGDKIVTDTGDKIKLS